MVVEYSPNSTNVIVLEDDVIGVAFWLEELLKKNGYEMDHYASMNDLLQSFKEVELDFVRIILDNQVPRFPDGSAMTKDGGLEVAKRIINKYHIKSGVICLHSRTEDKDLAEVLGRCEHLGIQYVPKKDVAKLESFLGIK